jgi:hypothetical protein
MNASLQATLLNQASRYEHILTFFAMVGLRFERIIDIATKQLIYCKNISGLLWRSGMVDWIQF